MNADIVAHPATFYTIMALLGGGFLLTLKVLIFFFEKRVNEKFLAVEGHNERQDKRLADIESDLRRYDTHVAVGVRESSEIHAAVARVEATLCNHVEKEETVTWQKIDDLVEAINVMRLANEEAHGRLTTGQATLGVRVEAVEKKMPNGELQKLAEAYHALAQRDLAQRTTRSKKR